MRPNPWRKLLFYMAITALAGLLTWLGALAAATQVYVQGLTHPVCLHANHTPTGYQAIVLTGGKDLSLPGYWQPASTGLNPSRSVVILLGGYASFDQQINQESAPALSSRWIVQRIVPIFFRLETGANTSQLTPVDDVAAISPRPLLLIYSDEEVDQAGGHEQFAATSQPKEL